MTGFNYTTLPSLLSGTSSTSHSVVFSGAGHTTTTLAYSRQQPDPQLTIAAANIDSTADGTPRKHVQSNSESNQPAKVYLRQYSLCACVCTLCVCWSIAFSYLFWYDYSKWWICANLRFTDAVFYGKFFVISVVREWTLYTKYDKILLTNNTLLFADSLAAVCTSTGVGPGRSC